MSIISTHVLDAVLGKPAFAITVRLETQSHAGWIALASGETNTDGRCRDLGPECGEGVYRLTFEVQDYFQRQQRKSIYREISITFRVDGISHYHLPLILSDNSYTTYRGS